MMQGQKNIKLYFCKLVNETSTQIWTDDLRAVVLIEIILRNTLCYRNDCYKGNAEYSLTSRCHGLLKQ
jgi:hypothetical protein